MRTTAILLATGLVALATPASANLSCFENTVWGDQVAYMFAPGGQGYVIETKYIKGYTPYVKPVGFQPIWSAEPHGGGHTWLRPQATPNWVLDFGARRPDGTHHSTLWKDHIQVGEGYCVLEPNDPGPQAAPRALPPTPVYGPAPVYAPPPARVDSVPIYPFGTSASVDVWVGSQWVRMLIDTGATRMQVPYSVGLELVGKGEAVLGPPMQAKIADGSVVTEQTIIINTIVVGNHRLTNVPAALGSNNADALLPFPMLNQMGRFTVDSRSNQLIFG
jgi:hypothetical protein